MLAVIKRPLGRQVIKVASSMTRKRIIIDKHEEDDSREDEHDSRRHYEDVLETTV